MDEAGKKEASKTYYKNRTMSQRGNRVIVPKGFHWRCDLTELPGACNDGRMIIYFAEFSHSMLKIGVSRNLPRRIKNLSEQVRPAGWKFKSVAWMESSQTVASILESTMKARWKHLRQEGTEWLRNAGFSTVLGSAHSYYMIALKKLDEV